MPVACVYVVAGVRWSNCQLLVALLLLGAKLPSAEVA